mmetsp:Transcript_45324/g.107851  ORF Transcript_45324/g.107851 Transcript_45324/m.107851 type:complete len:249 (+) Transcript_45324:805-1551(+)
MQRDASIVSNHSHLLAEQLRQYAGCLWRFLCWDGGQVVNRLERSQLHLLAKLVNAAIQRHGDDAGNCHLASLNLLAKDLLGNEIRTALSRHYVDNSTRLQMRLQPSEHIPQSEGGQSHNDVVCLGHGICSLLRNDCCLAFVLLDVLGVASVKDGNTVILIHGLLQPLRLVLEVSKDVDSVALLVEIWDEDMCSVSRSAHAHGWLGLLLSLTLLSLLLVLLVLLALLALLVLLVLLLRSRSWFSCCCCC